MDNTRSLVFRLLNESVDTVESAYEEWKTAVEEESVATFMADFISNPGEPPVITERTQSDKVMNVTTGPKCPNCGDILTSATVCHSCALGTAGIRLMYQCTCGKVLYTKEKL